MQISVIIPSYQSEKIIKKVLIAVTKQQTSAKYEIILVDSSPGTKVDEIVSEFENVIFYKQKNKTTASRARNIGASYAKGALLLFMDSDVTLDPTALEKALKYFNQKQRIFSGSLSLDVSNGFSFIAFCEFSFFFSESFENNPNRMRKNLPSTLLFISRDLFFELGEFKEFGRIEDTVLTELAKIKGNNLHFFPDIKAKFFQEVTFLHYLNKCKFNGINLPNIRFGVSSGITKKILIFLTIPLISLSKLVLMVYRNLFYRNNIKDIILFILSMPLIIAGILYWGWGLYIWVFNRNKIDQRR